MRVTQYLLICVVIIAMLTGIVSAIQPEYGLADVDGQPYEWIDYSDNFFQNDICRPMTDGNTVYAKECIRYDCDKKTAYIFLYDELDSYLLDGTFTPSQGFIDNNVVYFSALDDSTTPNFKWWSIDPESGYAWGYEASFPLNPGSYSFYTQAEFAGQHPTNWENFIVSTPPEDLEVTCGGVTPAPEFPSVFLPAAMIIGFLGAVLLIQRTREN